MRKRASIAVFGAFLGAVSFQCAPQERPAAPEPPTRREPVDAGIADVAVAPPPPPRETRVGSTNLACLRPGLDEELHRCATSPNPPIAWGEVWSKLDALTRARRPPPPKGGTTTPRPLTREETAFFDTARAYLCTEKSPPPNQLDLSFDRGRIYFEANHFEEAAVFFRDAMVHGGDSAPYAAQLLLECLNLLSKATPACVATMRDVMPVILAKLCGKGASNAETCDQLRRVDAQLEKLP